MNVIVNCKGNSPFYYRGICDIMRLCHRKQVQVPIAALFERSDKMTIQQEAVEKIMKLPEEGIRLILVIADEIARQYGILSQNEDEAQKNALLERKKTAFQNMIKTRENSLYPRNFDYKKVMEEAINEKYNIVD